MSQDEVVELSAEVAIAALTALVEDLDYQLCGIGPGPLKEQVGELRAQARARLLYISPSDDLVVHIASEDLVHSREACQAKFDAALAEYINAILQNAHENPEVTSIGSFSGLLKVVLTQVACGLEGKERAVANFTLASRIASGMNVSCRCTLLTEILLLPDSEISFGKPGNVALHEQILQGAVTCGELFDTVIALNLVDRAVTEE